MKKINKITIKEFATNHRLLCIGTLGLAIVAFAGIRFAGRVYSWIKEALGSTKKVHEKAVESFGNKDVEPIVQPTNAQKTDSITPEDWQKWGFQLDANDVAKAKLPDNIEELLEADCPFFTGKKVKESHILVWIPPHLKFNDLDDNFRKISPKDQPPIFHEWGMEHSRGCTASHSTPDVGHWILMTKEVIPNSLGTSYQGNGEAPKMPEPYIIPNNLTECTAAVLAHYFKTSEMLFHDTLFVCSEEVVRMKSVVGGFNLFTRDSQKLKGLFASALDTISVDDEEVGLVALRRL